jgi:hypothetical protein
MNDGDRCCQDLTRSPGAPSPFSRVIALDYHDGPRAGLLECGRCGRAYRFELLEEVLDDEDEPDLRVFSLAPLAPGAWDGLVEALAPYQQPRWPVWVPIWEFPTPEAEAAVDRRVQEILESASPPTLVVAARDLLGTILDARDADPLDSGRAVESILTGRAPAPPGRRAAT